MLLGAFLVLLAAEGDDRQQFLDLREHPLLDHFADFLIRGPARIAPVIMGALAQGVFHDLVAEVLRVADARGLFGLLQLPVEDIQIEDLPGVRDP